MLLFLVPSFYDGVFANGVYYACVVFIFLSLATVILALSLAAINMFSLVKHKMAGPIAMLIVNIVASKSLDMPKA